MHTGSISPTKDESLRSIAGWTCIVNSAIRTTQMASIATASASSRKRVAHEGRSTAQSARSGAFRSPSSLRPAASELLAFRDIWWISNFRMFMYCRSPAALAISSTRAISAAMARARRSSAAWSKPWRWRSAAARSPAMRAAMRRRRAAAGSDSSPTSAIAGGGAGVGNAVGK